jgi:hypothetical protein
MHARSSMPFAYCAALLLAPILALPTASLAEPYVNGRNVTAVYVGTGEYRLLPLKHWIEEGHNGATFNLVEYSRDDGSVYLSDVSRGVRLQLDLNRNHVFYWDSNGSPPRRLHSITDGSAQVNGRNVVLVETPQGRFRVTEPGHWVEQGENGSQFNFVENSRDERSIYLTDESRGEHGVRLQLDLHLMQVFHISSDRDARKQSLYAITRASAIGDRIGTVQRGDCDVAIYWDTGGCSSRREAADLSNRESQDRPYFRVRTVHHRALPRELPVRWRGQSAIQLTRNGCREDEGCLRVLYDRRFTRIRAQD